MLATQLIDDEVLREIGILILVDQDIAEEVAVLLCYLGVVAEEYVGVEQEVVEVHSTGTETSLPIYTVDVVHHGALLLDVHVAQFAIGGIGAGSDKGVLGIGNNALHGCGLVYLVVELHLLDDGLEERTRVGRVVYGEVGTEAQALGIGVKNARKDGVESAHPQSRSHLLAYELCNALFHLVGGLDGECESQNAPGLVARREKVCNLVGEYTGLTRAGTSNDELRAVGI